jgi:CRISPR/Cas system-associated exonuclease Cas4 (RecB family)
MPVVLHGDPSPLLRVFASSVSGRVGVNYRKTSADVMLELRRQRSGYVRPAKERMVPEETFWAVVGLVKDNYSQSTAQHIDAIKAFIGEDRPDVWYQKLYKVVRSSVGTAVHTELGTGVSPIRECVLSADVMLVGRVDMIEGDRVVEVKTTKKIEEVREDAKIQLFCYMKLCGLRKGVVRQVCGSDTQDTEVEWDETYWSAIERLILAFVVFV